MTWSLRRPWHYLCNLCRQVFSERRMKRTAHRRGSGELLILLHTPLPAEGIHFPSSQWVFCLKADLTWFNWRGGPHLCRHRKENQKCLGKDWAENLNNFRGRKDDTAQKGQRDEGSKNRKQWTSSTKMVVLRHWKESLYSQGGNVCRLAMRQWISRSSVWSITIARLSSEQPTLKLKVMWHMQSLKTQW